MLTILESRASLIADLLQLPAMPVAAADPLRPIFASLLAGRALNEGILPETLGLNQPDFQALIENYFPGKSLELVAGAYEDIPELADLVDLLMDFRSGLRDAETWLAHIVANGCAGRDHLWQDLGLANRGELSLLMTLAFSKLARLNVGDMKWKKFIYRQYCAREGIYVCPAPSCGECADYSRCFAPEE